MLGIVLELRAPGFGVPGIVGIASLTFFFWGHWLVQLAGWEEMLLVGSGLALLILEVFVIPGFGLAGVLGISALLAGLSLSLVGGGATWESIGHAAGRVIRCDSRYQLQAGANCAKISPSRIEAVKCTSKRRLPQLRNANDSNWLKLLNGFVCSIDIA